MITETNNLSPPSSRAVAEYKRRMELYRRNEEWMREYGAPLRERFRQEFPGQFFAVSQGEAFVAEDEDKAAQLAREKHPGDEPYVEMITQIPTPFIITVEPGDPELAWRSELRRRNSEWSKQFGPDFWDQYRGQYVAVSEGEIFVSEDAQEAERIAREKHPDDEPDVDYIPKEKYYRIYGNQGPMGTL